VANQASTVDVLDLEFVFFMGSAARKEYYHDSKSTSLVKNFALSINILS
jgi:hypothetical protein